MTTKNQSRSDARTAYLDGVLERPNLHLITGYTVTRVLYDTNNATFPNSTYTSGATGLSITGVEVSVVVVIIMPISANIAFSFSSLQI